MTDQGQTFQVTNYEEPLRKIYDLWSSGGWPYPKVKVDGFNYQIVPKPPFVVNKSPYEVAIDSGHVSAMILEEAE